MMLYLLLSALLLFHRRVCGFESDEQTDSPPILSSDTTVTPKQEGLFSFIDSLLSDMKKPTKNEDGSQTSDIPISPFDDNKDGTLIIKMNADSGESQDSAADTPNVPNTDGPAISNSDETDEKVITIPLLPQQQKNNTLENFFNRILDHLDSIFDFSQKKTSSDIDSLATPSPDEIPAPESSEEKLPLVDSTTAKPDDDSFSDSFGETFKTVTEESVQIPRDSAVSSNDKDVIMIVPPPKFSIAEDSMEIPAVDRSSGGSIVVDVGKLQLTANASSETSSENPAPSPVASSEESDEKAPLSQSLGQSLVDSYVDPVFCRAKCIQMCMADNNDDFMGCRAVCVASTLKNLCAQEDAPCQKACGSSPLNEELSAPNVTNVKYYQKDQVVDAETLEISWDALPGAVLYIITLIPDSRSAQSGSVIIHQDFSNVPWYTFKKRDICFAYYVRVSGVYADGITPYSPPIFADRAWAGGFPNIMVEQGDISIKGILVNELSSHAEFVEINLHLFSNLMFDFTKVQLSSYVLASGCQNPDLARSMLAAPRPFAAATPLGTPDGKVLVRNVQFLYLPQKIVVRLPVEYVNLNCNYEFRIALLRTKCGEIISFVSRIGFTFDSKVGVDFKVGCDTVRYSGCANLLGSEENNPIAALPQPDASNSVEDQSQTTSDAPAAVATKNCNMSGFSVDVIGNPIDNFNITLLWDNIADGRPKTYVVRHGRVLRHFIQDSGATSTSPADNDGNMSDDPDLVIPDDGNSDLSPKSVKLNRPLGPVELHQVRVCVLYEGETLSDADWASARRYAIDMAAFPQPVLAVDLPAFDGDDNAVPALTVVKLNNNDDQIVPWSKALIDRPISPTVNNDNDDDQMIWYRRLYLVQYNQAYWFYSSLIAFLLLLTASLLCFWACRCCFKNGRKMVVDAKRQTPPMIFVARNDSMKQHILPPEEKPEKKEQIPPV